MKKKKTQRKERTTESSYRRWIFDDPSTGQPKKRAKTFHPKGKKMSVDKAFDIVVQGLLNGKGLHPSSKEIWYAEKLAIECNLRVDTVRQVLHRLNLEGCCSKRIIWYSAGGHWGGCMHTRLDYMDQVVMWEAKKYYVYMDKLTEKYGK